MVTENIVFLQPLKAIEPAAKGDLAHLVERQVRNLKVAGSSPVISTKSTKKPLFSVAFSVLLLQVDDHKDVFDLQPHFQPAFDAVVKLGVNRLCAGDEHHYLFGFDTLNVH